MITKGIIAAIALYVGTILAMEVHDAYEIFSIMGREGRGPLYWTKK